MEVLKNSNLMKKELETPCQEEREGEKKILIISSHLQESNLIPQTPYLNRHQIQAE